MPGGDRTGPAGMGAMTGRRAGFCSGTGMPGYADTKFGRGTEFGYGRGRCTWSGGYGGGRRGRRNMFYETGLPGWMRYGTGSAPERYPVPYAPADPEMEKQMLGNQVRELKQRLDMIQKRLAEMEPGAKTD